LNRFSDDQGNHSHLHQNQNQNLNSHSWRGLIFLLLKRGDRQVLSKRFKLAFFPIFTAVAKFFSLFSEKTYSFPFPFLGVNSSSLLSLVSPNYYLALALKMDLYIVILKNGPLLIESG